MKTEIEWISVKDRLPACGGKYLFISGKIGESASIVLYHKSTNMFEKYIERIIPRENIRDIMCIPIILDHDSWWSHLPIPPQNLIQIKKEPKFKVGDRVEFIRENSLKVKGTICMIKNEIFSTMTNTKYLVKFDNDYDPLYCYSHEIKKLRPKKKELKVGDRVVGKPSDNRNKRKGQIRLIKGDRCMVDFDGENYDVDWIDTLELKKLRPVKREWKFGDRCIIKDKGVYHGKKGMLLYIETLFKQKQAASIKLDIHKNNNDVVWGNLDGLKRLVKKKKS